MKKLGKILDAMRVDKKNRLKLAKCKTDATSGMKDKKEARDVLAALGDELDDLQYKLYAESKTALLVIFQAMDTAGKDGVTRKVFSVTNPQGVRVTSFKRPTDLELSHDYLWRVHQNTPAKGMIGVFNRSQYEDILVPRVHGLLPEARLKERYRQINEFEKYLTQNNTVILKFFLHISKDEQERRLQARLEHPGKRWKFEVGDLAERKLWDNYQDAYQDILDRCSFPHAPWFVIPADNKWYRDWAVSSIVVAALRDINPEIPKEKADLSGITVE